MGLETILIAAAVGAGYEKARTGEVTSTGPLFGPIGVEAAGLMKPKTPKFPGVTELPEVPKLTVEEIEAQEGGWEEILKRAQGRRATILTEPQLAQMQPYTRRATLLAG